MRQTSRAVALLLTLESVSAADRPLVKNVPTPTPGTSISENAFNPAAIDIINASVILNSRTAPYANVNPSTDLDQDPSPTWADATARQAIAGAVDYTATTIKAGGGSGCMQCINGKGVWCSRTYAYLEVTDAYMYTETTQAAGGMNVVFSTTDAEALTGTKKDQGACCETALNFGTFIGTLSVSPSVLVAPTNGTSASGVSMQMAACPATTGDIWAAGPKFDNTNLALEAGTVKWTSWWCSNGLYKKVTGSGAKVMNAQQTIPQGTNKRQELAQIGCPQKAPACGITTGGINSELTIAVNTKSFTMPISGFTVEDKCTWMAYSVETAPTFTMADSGLTPSRGLVGAGYQIHNMEYTTSGSWAVGQQSLMESPAPAAPNDGFRQITGGLSLTTLLPLFWMPAAQFGSLRTWYGQGAWSMDAVSNMPSNWMSPGQAPVLNTGPISTQLAPVVSQLYGNVANVPVSGFVASATTTALGATQNFGTANNVKFDLRQMRYFPAKVAQTVHASGTALAAQYTTALGLYNGAKTTWDAYVAILEKNAKQDAFAALFSPPKAPMVPPLPNQPWVPATYNGYVRATAAEVAAYSAGATVAPTEVASPTAQQFWTSLSAAQTSGGWGSFTATIFTFRNGWGKSFGTIGYSGDADSLKMSDVWNYQWTCAAASAQGAAASTTSQCANTYTAAAGKAAASPGNATGKNQVKMVTVVSLWTTMNKSSNGNPVKNLWSANGFKITFTGSAWKSGIVGLTPIAASAQPVAAKSLKGIAGAQALAATSAAALAVAAALY